jgi:hypothetical protein
VQIVQDIQPPPVPLDTPMVLIKPRQSCKTPEIFKVSTAWLYPHWLALSGHVTDQLRLHSHRGHVSQQKVLK